MDWTLIGNLFLILLLVIGNAFFVGSEIALTSARRSQIKQLANTGNKSARIVQLLHNEPERFYSVTQIGITLVSLALGAIGMVTLTEVIDPGAALLFSVFGESEQITNFAHSFSYVIAFIIISFLHVVGGELAPKVLAFHKAVSMSLSVAWTINALHRVLRPIIWVMNKASNQLLWLFGQRDLAEHGESHFSMTAEEIRTILSSSEQEGVLDPQLTMMLRGVFDLDDHTARDAMVPRTDILALAHDDTITDALKLFQEERRERYPVHQNSIDNIIGVVSMKKLLDGLAHAESPDSLRGYVEQPLSAVMSSAYFVPDTASLSRLLKDFTNNRRQMAIVVDEYGGTEGLITLEDILEEIVGDYEDEFTPRHRHIKKEDKYRFTINGGVRVTELEPKLNFPFPTGEYVTLGGLIHQHLGRIATVGDIIPLEGAQLRVMEMDRHCITKVLFTHVVQEEEGMVPDEVPAEIPDEDVQDAPEGEDAPGNGPIISLARVLPKKRRGSEPGERPAGPESAEPASKPADPARMTAS